MYSSAKSPTRIEPIDAARGCAMVLVCLSHGRHYFDPDSSLYFWLTAVTRIATPTFLLLSGFVAGYLLRSDANRRVPVALVDRGLFLILVAHLFIGLADLPRVSTVEWLFVRASIPDAIGVALCLAPLFRRMSSTVIFVVGATLCVSSWFIAAAWAPQTDLTAALGRLLFNVRSEQTWLNDVSILPYFGTFLIGMGLSSHMHRALIELNRGWISRRLLTIGAISVGSILICALTWYFAKEEIVATLQSPAAVLLRETIDPRYKWPPSPAYLLFYGGAGLLIAGTFFAGWPSWAIGPIVRTSAVIGRASLMCFVLQDWLLLLVPQVFGFRNMQSPIFWAGYTALVIVTLYCAARAWDTVHGNRFFTVGLRALQRQRSRKRLAAAEGTEYRRTVQP
jgi:uncharacterized membrane protein